MRKSDKTDLEIKYIGLCNYGVNSWIYNTSFLSKVWEVCLGVNLANTELLSIFLKSDKYGDFLKHNLFF